MIDGVELAEKDCGACTNEWKMWSKIIADCGDARFGFWALALLELCDQIELFGGKLSDLTAREWDGLRAVRAAINRRQAFRQYEANKPDK